MKISRLNTEQQMEKEEFTVQPWQKIRSALGLFLKFQRPLTDYGYGEVDVTETLRKLVSRFTRIQLKLPRSKAVSQNSGFFLKEI